MRVETLLFAVILLTMFASVGAWSNTKTILERLNRLEESRKTTEPQPIDRE